MAPQFGEHLIVEPDEEEETTDEVYSVENRYIRDLYGTYYMCYGGGEQGGVFQHLETGTWYLVHLTGWGGEWKMTYTRPQVYTPADWRTGTPATVRAVETVI